MKIAASAVLWPCLLFLCFFFWNYFTLDFFSFILVRGDGRRGSIA
jgi:hypothetical protein